MLKKRVETGPLLTLETTPPNLPTLDLLIHRLEKSGAVELVDGFTTTDSPLSRPKYNSIISAYRLQEQFQKPVIATMSMRDRNWIALYGDLLGANDLGITHILALTGDPVRLSPSPVKGVFEGNSLKLLELIEKLNLGMDREGTPLKITPKPITPFGVTSSVLKGGKKGAERLIKKMEKKFSRGAVAVISQPVYSIKQGKLLLQLVERARELAGKGEIIFGFFPITSLKTALFLQNNVPGVEVPPSLISLLQQAKTETEEQKIGIGWSRNLFANLWELHPKIHFMCANRFTLLPEIVGEVIGYRKGIENRNEKRTEGEATTGTIGSTTVSIPTGKFSSEKAVNIPNRENY